MPDKLFVLAFGGGAYVCFLESSRAHLVALVVGQLGLSANERARSCHVTWLTNGRAGPARGWTEPGRHREAVPHPPLMLYKLNSVKNHPLRLFKMTQIPV